VDTNSTAGKTFLDMLMLAPPLLDQRQQPGAMLT
jgi:hypothetical protein